MKKERFNKFLKNKTVSEVYWLSKEEANLLGWNKRPLVIKFSDGTFIVPTADDERNDGGSLIYVEDDKPTTIYSVR